MLSKLQDFLGSEKKFSHRSNKRLIEYIQGYYFSYISSKDKYKENQQIIENIKKSTLITINNYKEQTLKADKLYFIISFKKMIIIINHTFREFIEWIISMKPQIQFFFLYSTKVIFDKKFNIKYTETPKYFNDKYIYDEIDVFNESIHLNISKYGRIREIWRSILPCISGYIIKESYSKTIYDRITEFYNNQNKINESMTIDENNLIKVRNIGDTNTSQIDLFCDFENFNFFAVKIINPTTNEYSTLKKRESKNYTKINNPFLPRFYGLFDDNNLIIEFINGQTLSKIHELNFSEEEKSVIIFQLLLAFQYIHDNQFVYRDLKPENVMINEINKIITIIDFDRMINISDIKDNEHTIDLNDKFLAPEVNYGKISYKNDIYSLGKMMEFILSEEDLIQNQKLFSIYNRCIDLTPENRPSISDLIAEVYFLFNFYIDKSFLKKLQLVQFLQKIFRKLEFKIISKLISYFSLASNQNNSEAQYKIGLIFLKGKLIQRDINHSIYYLKLSANQNNSKAQYKIGLILWKGKLIQKDIDHSIYYLKLAESQNYSKARSKLIQIFSQKNNHCYKFNLYQNLSNKMKNIECSFKNSNKIVNQELFEICERYSIVYVYADFLISDEINQNIKKSKLIIIYYYTKYSCFIVSFEQTVLMVNFSILCYLFSLFPFIQKVNICFLNKNSKKIFDRNIKIEYIEIKKDQQFEKEIKSFNKELTKNQIQMNNSNEFLNVIKTCISSYLIKESYFKLPIDRFSIFYRDKDIYKYHVFERKDYIILTNISNFDTFLIYILNGRKLAVLKDQYFNYDKNSINTYSIIKHQYLPKFYGITDDRKSIIVEYIKGKSLTKIKEFTFSKNEKVTLIFQIVSIIRYLHELHFIYRYLNPDNIIIDASNNISLINFDRILIGNKTTTTKPEFNDLIAPEVKKNSCRKISQRCDVYTLGKIIYYIINEEYDFDSKIESQIKFSNFSEFKEIYEECILEDPKSRIDTPNLIHDIFRIMLQRKIPLNENDSETYYNYGFYIHREKWLDVRDVNEIIKNYIRGSSMYHMIANHNIAVFYYENYLIQRDIAKSIHYFELAGSLNDAISIYKLGLIYYNGEFIDQDINQSIKLFKRAADLNDSDALIQLGLMLYEGENIDQNVKKSLEYLKRAADQDNSEAQFHLGKIFYKGKYVKKDISISLSYLHLAAEQNHKIAQYKLGKIYYKGIFVTKNVNRGIYFIEESSKKEYNKAMFFIASLCQKGRYIIKDIDRAVGLFKEASINMENYAKNNIGIIFRNEIAIAKTYLNESIKKKDKVSMYNMALINYTNNCSFDESIKLLIKSSELDFDHSTELLCLILIKKFENELFEYSDQQAVSMYKCYNNYSDNACKESMQGIHDESCKYSNKNNNVTKKDTHDDERYKYSNKCNSFTIKHMNADQQLTHSSNGDFCNESVRGTQEEPSKYTNKCNSFTIKHMNADQQLTHSSKGDFCKESVRGTQDEHSKYTNKCNSFTTKHMNADKQAHAKNTTDKNDFSKEQAHDVQEEPSKHSNKCNNFTIKYINIDHRALFQQHTSNNGDFCRESVHRTQDEPPKYANKCNSFTTKHMNADQQAPARNAHNNRNDFSKERVHGTHEEPSKHSTKDNNFTNKNNQKETSKYTNNNSNISHQLLSKCAHRKDDFDKESIRVIQEDPPRYPSNHFINKFINITRKIILKYTEEVDSLMCEFVEIIESLNLADQKAFEKEYHKQVSIYYSYNELFEVVPYEESQELAIKIEEKNEENNITDDFVEGFKNDLF